MRPKQPFLGDPGNLDEGAEPKPPFLEGAGEARPSQPGPASPRPCPPRAPSSGVINLHAAIRLGNVVNASHWPKSSQAEQVQSVTLALRPP